MVRGVNDSSEMAQKLANLIKGMGAHVNLIPINPVDGSPYSATDDANVHRFQKELEALGVNATVRRRLGTDISAACGGLNHPDLTLTVARNSGRAIDFLIENGAKFNPEIIILGGHSAPRVHQGVESFGASVMVPIWDSFRKKVQRRDPQPRQVRQLHPG